MSRQFFVSTQRDEKNDTDTIGVHVSRDDRRKCVSFFYCPAKDNGDSHIQHITRGHYINGEPMGRLNNKRLDAIYDEVKAQIEAKDGPHYDNLKAAAAALGLTLA